MQAEKRHVELNINGAGRGTVIVDGHDLSHCVRAIKLEGAVGEATVVTLEIHGVRVTADVEALVRALPIAPQPRTEDADEE